jgi:hypothetical protein
MHTENPERWAPGGGEGAEFEALVQLRLMLIRSKSSPFAAQINAGSL